MKVLLKGMLFFDIMNESWITWYLRSDVLGGTYLVK